MIATRLYRMIAAAAVALFLGAGSVHGAEGMEQVTSTDDVATTTERLVEVLEEKGMNVFAVIDHAAGAREAGMELPPTRLVIFGNPKVGTQLMHCDRSTAIDLPMKMLVWAEDGAVYVGYNTPAYLAQRHGLEDCGPVLGNIEEALRGFADAAAG
ncbi:DUF302 domain-containing protein [Arhodomonas sp. SL1]|uniref:DUF302 domain-containing protein n=1 Tax=Arhodomonas sp. SL1 TaxID=3425691 RepID=UPI003F88577B